MDIKRALAGQYLAGLAMLRQTVERCPDEVWISGIHPRTFWRIAFHAVFFTHLYLEVNEHTFQPWEKGREGSEWLWGTPEELEPYSQSDLLEYIDIVTQTVETKLNAMDIESAESGFHWYPGVAKLDHQIMTIRHLQGHIGQLSEILMAGGVDTNWIALR